MLSKKFLRVHCTMKQNPLVYYLQETQLENLEKLQMKQWAHLQQTKENMSINTSIRLSRVYGRKQCIG